MAKGSQVGRYVWSAALLAGLPLILVAAFGCGGGSVSGPDPVAPPAPALEQLPAPAVLRGRWAPGDQAALVPPGDNVVLLTPSYANDEPREIARALAARHLPVIVYAGHIYVHPPSTWSGAWVNFAAYLEPFRAAGVLVGLQPLDEPRHMGYQDLVAAAHADARARGYRVLATEWADQVAGRWHTPRPPGTDWWAMTCTQYPGTMWTASRCGEALAERADVDALAAPGFDAGTGPPDRAAWTAAAGSKGLLWWETAE